MARYGNTRVSRIRKRIEALRQAIRAHDPEAAEKAWDDLEPYIPALMAARAALGEKEGE